MTWLHVKRMYWRCQDYSEKFYAEVFLKNRKKYWSVYEGNTLVDSGESNHLLEAMKEAINCIDNNLTEENVNESENLSVDPAAGSSSNAHCVVQ